MYKHVRAVNMLIDILSPHDKQCAEFVASTLPLAVGAIYVQSYNRTWITNAVDDILKITLKVKENFLGIIQEADGIDHETKKRMKEQLQLTTYIIGYINDFTNNSKVSKFHEDFELFEENTFSDAAIRILVKQMTRDDLKWFYESFYMTEALIGYNKISYTFPESGFFNSEQPNYINYGAIGFLMGEKIANFFGLIDFEFYSDAATSTNYYINKSKCFIEQYSNYTVKELGLNLDGSTSRNTNVADHGGIKAAYRAYNDLSTTDKRLPGLSYTPKQMFWINYANVWCQKTTPELLKKRIASKLPPNKFRVIGPLSNMPEFAKDFKCPSGSNMNPVKKCSVW